MNKNVVAEPAINIPFRRYIPAGTCHFEIAIPEEYRNRRFTFSHVLYFAEYYSLQAAQMDLDTDFELDEEMSFTLRVHVPYPEPSGLYPGVYNPSDVILHPPHFAKEFNDFFEIRKPTGLVSTGAFFDWWDTRIVDSGYTLKQWVEEVMAVTYYGEAFNPAVHFNALPTSARKLPGVNNYAVPNQWDEELRQCLQYRLHLAPNTNFLCSNGTPMNDLGFSEKVMGGRKPRQRFLIRNSNMRSYTFLQSDIRSQFEMTKTTNKFNGFLTVNTFNYISDEIDFEISKRSMMSTYALEKKMNSVLRSVERISNLRVGFQFDNNTKRCEFLFPLNFNFFSMKVVTDPALLQRLGFGLVGEVGPDNSKGSKIIDPSDVKDAREKATAVANDAGIFVVTDENSWSGNTVGVYERVLANLFPVSEGKMELRAADSCSQNSALKIAGYMPVVDGYVNARLKVWRFVDKGNLVGAVLKMGSWIQGSLRSV